MLRCIHCGCFIPTAGTDKCPNCGEYPYSQKSERGRNASHTKYIRSRPKFPVEEILRTKEEKEGWEKIKRMDKI